MNGDSRSWRIALVPDALINPPLDRGTLGDMRGVIEASGYGILQLPPAGEHPLLLAVIADQVAEYSHHGYAVMAVGVHGEPGHGLHWRRLAPLLRHRGVALPPRHLIRPDADAGLERQRLAALLADYDLPPEEQRRWRVQRSDRAGTANSVLGLPYLTAMHSECLQPDLKLAATLFDSLARATRRGRGIVRDSYGAGEQAAHDIMQAAARAMGLDVSIDAIGNLMMTLPGRDRAAPRIMIGSHLDSVPQGGNYDGAAGVVAGLCVLSALRRTQSTLECDITVMGIRAEESAWFDVAYLGSGGAFGLLDPACLSIARSDNGRSLEATMLECGFEPQAIRERRRLLDPSRIRAYLELHIEQGPTLVAEELPAAVVSGIRGCKRFRNARCVGRYGHSGAVNRPQRHDAVAATVALLHHLQTIWLQQEQLGADLTITSGELYTDPTLHGPSKIAGETHFVIDVRSVSDATMNAVAAEARSAAARIGEEYRVAFELGDTSDSPPAVMDSRLREALRGLLERPFDMASGAGHDAAVFAKMGIPTGMIFVRNEHGSHNPDEAMTMEDFAVGTRALLGLLLEFPRL